MRQQRWNTKAIKCGCWGIKSQQKPVRLARREGSNTKVRKGSIDPDGQNGLGTMKFSTSAHASSAHLHEGGDSKAMNTCGSTSACPQSARVRQASVRQSAKSARPEPAKSASPPGKARQSAKSVSSQTAAVEELTTLNEGCYFQGTPPSPRRTTTAAPCGNTRPSTRRRRRTATAAQARAHTRTSTGPSSAALDGGTQALR